MKITKVVIRIEATKGAYKGLKGYGDFSIAGYKQFGNVMFYPDSKIPYRTCLGRNEYKILVK